MNEIIELAIESPDGIVDCRLEPQGHDAASSYAVTILYPSTASGYSRSDIFCHILKRDGDAGGYSFDESEDIHPKIKKLEGQLSDAIMDARKGK